MVNTIKTPRNLIKKHYDIVSPYYQKLWSNHIHHGYYKTGKESKKVATENFLKYLLSKKPVNPDQRVLDIVCGIGGTSIYLAKNYNCKVDGITFSSVQVDMANELAKNLIKNNQIFL